MPSLKIRYLYTVSGEPKDQRCLSLPKEPIGAPGKLELPPYDGVFCVEVRTAGSMVPGGYWASSWIG